MAVSPSSSVRQAREALAQRLRDIRIEAGLSARAIAQAAGRLESKCSRIEHARTSPVSDSGSVPYRVILAGSLRSA
jgi:transcriptional regulator with XRE-family HTH domain